MCKMQGAEGEGELSLLMVNGRARNLMATTQIACYGFPTGTGKFYLPVRSVCTTFAKGNPKEGRTALSVQQCGTG